MTTALKKYPEDILLSIGTIEIHIRDIYSSDEYEANITITDAVERRLAIIGEAMNKINEIDRTIAITGKSKIINLRNILIHEYDLIEDSTIWNIIHYNLPSLKSEVQALLNDTN